jgi:hypothetical protein
MGIGLLGGVLRILVPLLGIGALDWWRITSYDHWAQECHANGGVVRKTGTTALGVGDIHNTYASLARAGTILSHHTR